MVNYFQTTIPLTVCGVFVINRNKENVLICYHLLLNFEYILKLFRWMLGKVTSSVYFFTFVSSTFYIVFS